MMQGVRFSSSTKKLAKVNMPNILLGLHKARKEKINVCWELDNSIMSKDQRTYVGGLVIHI